MRRTLLGVVALLVVAACDAGGDGVAGDASAASLDGLLAVDGGACEDEGVTEGSWFRMVQSGGTAEEGPFVANADSPCGDQTWTPLAPGADGGLRLGDYQPMPDEPFDDDGNGTASAILGPQSFFAVEFAVATAPTDRQTGTEVPAPEITHNGDGGLSGQVTAFSVAWNGQFFNQGAPKPEGAAQEGTAAPEGTYDAESGAFTLTWRSRIEGGPFDGFTGVWHLEGTHEP